MSENIVFFLPTSSRLDARLQGYFGVNFYWLYLFNDPIALLGLGNDISKSFKMISLWVKLERKK